MPFSGEGSVRPHELDAPWPPPPSASGQLRLQDRLPSARFHEQRLLELPVHLSLSALRVPRHQVTLAGAHLALKYTQPRSAGDVTPPEPAHNHEGQEPVDAPLFVPWADSTEKCSRHLSKRARGPHLSAHDCDQLFSSPVLLSPIFPRPQHTHTLWDHPPNKLQTRVLGSGFASGEKPRLSSWYSKWP